MATIIQDCSTGSDLLVPGNLNISIVTKSDEFDEFDGADEKLHIDVMSGLGYTAQFSGAAIELEIIDKGSPVFFAAPGPEVPNGLREMFNGQWVNHTTDAKHIRVSYTFTAPQTLTNANNQHDGCSFQVGLKGRSGQAKFELRITAHATAVVATAVSRPWSVELNPGESISGAFGPPC